MHHTDSLSLAFGLVFLGTAGVWAAGRLVALDLATIGWLVAGALMALGLAGIVRAVTGNRHAGDLNR
jgi:hypothetical protein